MANQTAPTAADVASRLHWLDRGASTGEISVPVDVLRQTADLLLAAAAASAHTAQCIRSHGHLLHRGEGPCACQRYTEEQVEAAARALDTDGLWDLRWLPNPDGTDRGESYRNMLRTQVLVVLNTVGLTEGAPSERAEVPLRRAQ